MSLQYSVYISLMQLLQLMFRINLLPLFLFIAVLYHSDLEQFCGFNFTQNILLLLYRLLLAYMYVIYFKLFIWHFVFTIYSGLMPDVEYSVLSQWFDWILTNNAIKADLIGEVFFISEHIQN